MSEEAEVCGINWNMDRESRETWIEKASEMARKLIKWTAKAAWLCHVSVPVANGDAGQRDMPLQEGESATSLDRNNSGECRHLCHSDELLWGVLCSQFANKMQNVHPLSSSTRHVYSAFFFISWWGKTWTSAQDPPLPIWPSSSSSSFCLCPLKNPASGQSKQS